MSTLKTNTIKNTDDVEMYLAKAWVNFNGTGTVAIRAAGNVSSITDNGTGTYTVNFTTSMPDINFGASSFLTDDGVTNRAINEQGPFGTYRTTSSIRVTAHNTNASGSVDAQGVYVAIFR